MNTTNNLEVSYEPRYEDEDGYLKEGEFYMFIELTQEYEKIRQLLNSINCEELGEGFFVVYMTEKELEKEMLSLGVKMIKDN